MRIQNTRCRVDVMKAVQTFVLLNFTVVVGHYSGTTSFDDVPILICSVTTGRLYHYTRIRFPRVRVFTNYVIWAWYLDGGEWWYYGVKWERKEWLERVYMDVMERSLKL